MRVVLVARHEGPNRLGRQQPGIVAEIPKLPCPMLRPAARLHRDHARHAVGEVLQELRPRQLQVLDLAGLHIDPVQLEHTLRRIHPDDGSVSLHLGPSGLPVKSSLFHLGTLMPSAREGPLTPRALEHQGGRRPSHFSLDHDGEPPDRSDGGPSRRSMLATGDRKTASGSHTKWVAATRHRPQAARPSSVARFCSVVAVALEIARALRGRGDRADRGYHRRCPPAARGFDECRVPIPAKYAFSGLGTRHERFGSQPCRQRSVIVLAKNALDALSALSLHLAPDRDRDSRDASFPHRPAPALKKEPGRSSAERANCPG